MRADRVLNQSHTAATPRDSVPVPVVRAGGGYRYLLEVATTLAEQFVVLPPRGRGAHRCGPAAGSCCRHRHRHTVTITVTR
jgi:hypothetical protein